MRIIVNAHQKLDSENHAGSDDVVGSICPGHIEAKHCHEIVIGSGISPEIAAANFESLEGQTVIECLAGNALDAVKGHGKQHTNAARPSYWLTQGGER